jgi:hypothetical protein
MRINQFVPTTTAPRFAGKSFVLGTSYIPPELRGRIAMAEKDIYERNDKSVIGLSIQGSGFRKTTVTKDSWLGTQNLTEGPVQRFTWIATGKDALFLKAIQAVKEQPATTRGEDNILKELYNNWTLQLNVPH